MTLAEASLKINLRLNKGDSEDYDNLWNYHKSEAFNKAVLERLRRQVHGNNARKEGDEATTMAVDDLQSLLSPPTHLNVRDKGLYAQTDKLPKDYLFYKRVTALASKGNCSGVRLRSHLREEANVDQLLPTCSFDFEESFHTLSGNKINLYHNGGFTIDKAELVYYRRPKTYDFAQGDVELEFKEDLCELLVDDTCRILSGDIGDYPSNQVIAGRDESNA